MIKIAKQGRRAFGHSVEGGIHLLSSEFAARIEVYAFAWFIAFLFIIGAPGYFFFLGAMLFLGLIAVEALNTAIEVLTDHVSPEITPAGKQAKDLGSFAVMCFLLAWGVLLAFIVRSMGLGYTLERLVSPLGRSVIALTLLVAAFVCFAKGRAGMLSKTVILLAVVFSVVGIAAYFTANYFTGAGLDEIALQQMSMGLGGSGVGEYSNLLVANVLAIIGLIAALVVGADILGKRRLGLSRFVHRIVTVGDERFLNDSLRRPKTNMRLGASLLALGVLANPISTNIMGFIKTLQLNQEELVVDNGGLESVGFFSVPEEIGFKGKKNVVFVYLESLEQTYLDETRFPGLTPNLKRLSTQGLHFTDIRTVRDTKITIAGMVGSQCGLPLFTKFSKNAGDKFDRFLPNTTCIGDILNRNGYRTAFVGGAKLQFAGKGDFLRSHGFQETIGYETHIERFPEDQFHSWGLYDDKMYTVLNEKFDELASSSDRFALFGLTLDTHHPSGHLSDSCGDTGYQDGSNDILNAVHCADRFAGAFVDRILAGPHANDTIIVLASDHLALRNSASKALASGPRSNLLIIIGSDVPPRKVTKPVTMLDTGITLLGLMGYPGNELAFGRDTFSDAPNLIAASDDNGSAILNRGYQRLVDQLWEMPSLKGGFTVDLAKTNVVMEEDRTLDLPFVLKLSDAGEILDVDFDTHHIPGQARWLGRRLSQSGRLLWIDDCLIMSKFEVEMNGVPGDPDQWCVAARPGNADETPFVLVEALAAPTEDAPTTAYSRRWLNEQLGVEFQ